MIVIVITCIKPERWALQREHKEIKEEGMLALSVCFYLVPFSFHDEKILALIGKSYPD